MRKRRCLMDLAPLLFVAATFCSLHCTDSFVPPAYHVQRKSSVALPRSVTAISQRYTPSRSSTSNALQGASSATATEEEIIVNKESLQSSDIDFIVSALKSSSGVFEKLSQSEIEKLAQSFESISVPFETNICQQGDAGDYFYIIASGNVKFIVDEEEVGTAAKSQTFGELALIDEAGGVRAATVTAYKDESKGSDRSSDSVSLYRVDRQTFRSVLGDDTLRRIGVRDTFIKEALSFSYVFDELGSKELDTLVDAFEPYTAKQGNDICLQGDEGDYFYIIQSGTVKYTVDGKEVGTAGTSQAFGELALVGDGGKRAATVTAYGGDVSLYRVDRDTFRSVLGDQTVQNVDVYTKRVELKKKLQEAAIKSFNETLPDRYCEDIMCEMEQMRPIARPAFHPGMNGDWCMVKTGVNTMDMTLITVLSTISRFLPSLVEFEDCYISLSNGATLVTCYIYLKLFGAIQFRMNAFTKMELDNEHPEGTLMYESFQGASIMGIGLPLPKTNVARPMEITYLDEDIMIARNDGGEPHLLVRIRNSPEEDPDHKYTGFFEDARLLYGEKITRKLVDRRLGQDEDASTVEAERIRKALEKAKSLAATTSRDRLDFY